MSLEKDLLKYKLQIKEWERSFATDNGRIPSKADVKANQEIYKAYKTYNHLKSKQKKKQQQAKREVLKDNVEKKSGASTLEPLDFVPSVDAEEGLEDEGNALSHAELGPTPQANGKVLSLFDIMSPPESSPSLKENMSSKLINSSPLKDAAVFKTPTKSVKRIELSDLTPARNNLAKKSLTTMLQLVSTPNRHAPSSDNIETPFYLGKVNNRFQFSPGIGDLPLKNSPTTPVRKLNEHPKTPSKLLEEPRFLTSPSPFKTERMSSFGNNKKLTDVFNEAINIQIDEELKAEVESELMLEMERELEDEGAAAQDEPIARKTRKRITQKRTTRRWKIKPRGESEVIETFDGKNVHEEIKKLEEKEKNDLIEYIEGPREDQESYSSEEETEVAVKPKLLESINKRKKLTPISNNFKRLKINDPRTKRFKQRMRRR